MKIYQKYTITLILNSSVATPFQSDTIFGHICWAIQYLKWENNRNLLEELLYEFDHGDSPPLLISNGFPEGFLPKPILPPPCREKIDKIVGPEERVQNAYRIKAVKKIEYIRKDHYSALIEKGLNSEDLFEILYNNFDIYQKLQKTGLFNIQRNSVNRIYNTVTDGLHLDQELFFPREKNRYEIYLKTDFFSIEDLRRIFAFISRQGFGKNKSTGRGAFDYEINEKINIPLPETVNGFMSLSLSIPSKNDPTEGYYDLLHKFGKLGGGYHHVLKEAEAIPFKVPLLMMKAGSLFYDNKFTEDKKYGSLLKNVHGKSQRIRHYAIAFPTGIFLKEEREANGN